MLYEHPAVQEAAVIGVPRRGLGEEVGAAVVLKQGEELDADELKGYVQGAARRLQVPAQAVVRGRAAEGADRQDPEAGDRGAGEGRGRGRARGGRSYFVLIASQPSKGRPWSVAPLRQAGRSPWSMPVCWVRQHRAWNGLTRTLLATATGISRAKHAGHQVPVAAG